MKNSRPSAQILEKRQPFGSTGLQVSPLGFGGAEVGLLGLERAEVHGLLNTILDLGINVIDTAAMYDQSESLIGEGISHRRDEFILFSKCGHALDDCAADAWSPALIEYSIDRSLRLLQTDHLDVMFLHSCSLEILEQGDAIESLIKAQTAGKIRFVGYSGDNEALLHAANLESVAAIETSVNICDQRNISRGLPACVENAIGVLAKRPLANVAWKSVNEMPERYREYASTYINRFAAMNLTPDDLGFEGSPDQIWPELALRFTLAQPGVHSAIVGTTNLTHLQSNISALEEPPLDPAVIEKLQTVFSSAEDSAEDKPWLSQT